MNRVSHGLSLFSLARALVLMGDDQKRAIGLAMRAGEVFMKSSKAFKKEIEDVDAWLQKFNEPN